MKIMRIIFAVTVQVLVSAICYIIEGSSLINVFAGFFAYFAALFLFDRITKNTKE